MQTEALEKNGGYKPSSLGLVWAGRQAVSE